MKYVFIIALVFCSWLNSGCSIVGPGEKGIRLTFGKASDEALDPGLHLWVPFALGIKRLDMRIQKSEYDTNSSSKDMQTVQTKFAINWRIDGSKVAQVYKTIGNEDDILSNIIDPALSETLKAAMAKKTAEEVLTKREDLKNEVDAVIKGKMAAYGIIVESINITNVEFSKDFSKAIEEKQVAEQQAQQAVYEAQKATQEANAQRNRAKGQADAQTLLKTTLTSELLRMKAIEKWDGKFPQYMSGTLPFLSIKANE